MIREREREGEGCQANEKREVGALGVYSKNRERES